MNDAADREFIDLFAQEARDRLQRLGEQLLQLESEGPDSELVADIFREAHTLKGAAAVVGLDEVSQVAHRLEDFLEPVRSEGREPTSELIDAALATVDGLNEIVPLVLAGQDCSAEARELSRSLDVWTPPPAPADTARDSQTPPDDAGARLPA